MDANPLQKGLKFASDAVQKDTSGNYHEALGLYKSAIGYFKEAQSEDDLSQDIKNILPTKISEYEQRVNQLQITIEKDQLSILFGPGDNQITTTSHIQRTQGLSPPLPSNEMFSGPICYSSDDSHSDSDCDDCHSDKGRKIRPGRRGELSLETALNLVNKAKKKDLSKKYVEAFILYMQALEYLSDAAKHAPGGILVSLNKNMKAYVERAEKIKVILEKYNKVPKYSKPVFPTEESVTEYHLMKAHQSGIDGRIGNPEKKITTNFWNDGRPFIFQVQLNKNDLDIGDTIEINVLLENKTSIEVDSIRVHLNEFITTTTILVNAN